MSDDARTEDEIELSDEDRLPWLEAVEDDDGNDGVAASKLIGFVVAALIALGIVVARVAHLCFLT